MSVNVDRLADELIRLLAARGQRADRFTTGPGVAGLNIWGEEGRYPLASVTVSDAGNFHDYAWGHNYEHTLPHRHPTCRCCRRRAQDAQRGRAVSADEQDIRQRAATAATAVERLARSLAHRGTDDQVAVAYIMRLLEAAARVEDYTEHDRRRVEPDPNYLGGLRRGMGTSAERYA